MSTEWDAATYDRISDPQVRWGAAVLDRLGLKAMRIGGTLANFPPAAVYRIRRRSSRIIPTRWAVNPLPTPANVPAYATRADFDPILQSRMRPLDG